MKKDLVKTRDDMHGRQRRGRLLIALAVLCVLPLDMGCTSRKDKLGAAIELQRQGRFGEALAPLRELLDDAPTDPQLNRLYGESLLRTGQAGNAVWPLQRAAQSPEYAKDASMLLARALQQSGSNEDAIEVTTRILGEDPENAEALSLRAQAHLTAMDHQSALDDLDRLLKMNPDDLSSRLKRLVVLLRLGRVKDVEAELTAVEQQLTSSETPDPELLANLCVVRATFEHERGDAKKADSDWETCLREHPTDPTVVEAAVDYYAETRQGTRVTEVLQAALEREPEEHAFRNALAARYRVMGRPKDAEALLVEGVEKYPSADGYGALADHYSEVGDYASAAKAIEKSFTLMKDVPEIARFGYADLLIQARDFERATRAMSEVKLPVYRHMLSGRLRLEQGDPAGGLQELEAGILLWPNSAAARLLAGRAAEQLGDFKTAASHYREGVRLESSEATVALAELAAAQGQPRVAIEVLNSALAKLPYDRSIWLSLVRIAGAAKLDAPVRQGLQGLAGLWGGLPLATVEAMKLRGQSGGPAAALEWLKTNPLDLDDPANEPVLGAFVDAQLALGRPAEALKRVEEAIHAHPEHAGFQALRGHILISEGSLDTAEAALQHALQLDPASSAALEGLAAIAEQRGQKTRAVNLYDRAAAADPSDPEPGWLAFQLVRSAPDVATDSPVDRLEGFLRAHPHHAEAALALAELKVEAKDYERAAELARRAINFGVGARGSELLARVEVEKGDPDAALEALQRMNARDRTRPAAQYWLGRARAAKGDLPGARDALRKALSGESFPEAEQARADLSRLADEGGTAK